MCPQKTVSKALSCDHSWKTDLSCGGHGHAYDILKENQKILTFGRASQVSDWGYAMVAYKKIYLEI